jgi:hypothetical protein
MKKKLNRRELVQAGVVTSAVLALAEFTTAPIRPAEGEGTASIESLLTSNYGHVPDYCDGTWKNPACAGNPGYWQSCSPRPSVPGQNQSCGHSL